MTAMKQRTFLILVAEDKPKEIELLQTAVERAGLEHPVRFVGSPEEIMAYLSGEKEFSNRSRFPLPGVIILDPELRQNSGVGVLEWLKKRPELRAIPVIMLASQLADIQRAYELGAASYLLRPVDGDELVPVLAAIAQYWALNEPLR